MTGIAMRSQFFVIVLSFSVLNSQENGWPEEVTEIELNASFYIDYVDENYTYPLLNTESVAPCKSSIRGLSSLGLMITYITVSVLSVVGNGVVVYVVCNMKRGRTTTDVYLMHLALADLAFALTLPFWAVYVNSQWVFGTFLCKLLSGLQEASFYGGVFLLACISVDRYLAVVKATEALSRRRRLAGAACGAAWLAAVALSLPAVFNKEAARPEEAEGQTVCYENLTAESGDRWRTGARVLRHALGFFLPLAVMGVCYGCTVGSLCRARNNSQKRKAMRVILAVVLAFVLCWLPHNVSVLADTLMRSGALGGETCGMRNGVRLASSVTEAMAFAHCAVNPLLYAFVGQRFRNQLLATLYRHGILSKRAMVAYRKGSSYSSGSHRSRNTSVTL